MVFLVEFIVYVQQKQNSLHPTLLLIKYYFYHTNPIYVKRIYTMTFFSQKILKLSILTVTHHVWLCQNVHLHFRKPAISFVFNWRIASTVTISIYFDGQNKHSETDSLYFPSVCILNTQPKKRKFFFLCQYGILTFSLIYIYTWHSDAYHF